MWNKVRGMKQLVLRLFSQVHSKMQLISRILVSLLVRARTLSPIQWVQLIRVQSG